MESIDFSNPDAVLHLNTALLKAYYGVTHWSIPKGFLCPPIPGRADYIHHLADVLAPGVRNIASPKIRGLDIGVGANCIYPILGVKLYGWEMVGVDINELAVKAAKENVAKDPHLKNHVQIRHQQNPSYIFKGVVGKEEYFDFSICNPPFFPSREAAIKAGFKKNSNLGNQHTHIQNFGGQANELWCNGGEALFIKRMIKESLFFKEQVGWFTSLVSKQENLISLYKQLEKAGAVQQTIAMSQGNKKSRILAWRFD